VAIMVKLVEEPDAPLPDLALKVGLCVYMCVCVQRHACAYTTLHGSCCGFGECKAVLLPACCLDAAPALLQVYYATLNRWHGFFVTSAIRVRMTRGHLGL
jgi:hypothetical protein